MDIGINTTALGIFTYVCAGNYEPMKTIGFVLLMVGMIWTVIAYQNLKEQLDKLKKQDKINVQEKKNVI